MQCLQQSGDIGVVPYCPSILAPESVAGLNRRGQLSAVVHRAGGDLLVRDGDISAASGQGQPPDQWREIIRAAPEWYIHGGQSEGAERSILHYGG
jgi:hypothetical protein